MRAVLICTFASLSLLLGGCASYDDDLHADAYTIDLAGDARPAAGGEYYTYSTYPYSGDYTPYYYGSARRSTLLDPKPYYYRDYYPSPRFWRAPGYRTFDHPPYRGAYDPLGRRIHRYPFDYDDHRRFDRDFDRRFDRGRYDTFRRTTPRHTYTPPGDRFHFRGDHFRSAPASPRRR